MKDKHTYGKKWPEMVLQRSFIKEHSFRIRVYSPLNSAKFNHTSKGILRDCRLWDFMFAPTTAAAAAVAAATAAQVGA